MPFVKTFMALSVLTALGYLGNVASLPVAFSFFPQSLPVVAWDCPWWSELQGHMEAWSRWKAGPEGGSRRAEDGGRRTGDEGQGECVSGLFSFVA